MKLVSELNPENNSLLELSVECMVSSVGWEWIPRQIKGGHHFTKSQVNECWGAKATLTCYTELMFIVLMLYTYNFVTFSHLFTAYLLLEQKQSELLCF